MAKIYGLFGSMTGKLADTVMSVRNGEQIARKYQPIVLNPSTPAQIAQRAKLKLMSQLSAAMADVIAIPRRGSVSSRNLFTKANFGETSYADATASVTLTNITLTNSAISLPGIQVTATGQSTIGVTLTAGASFDRVVYAAFLKTEDNKLRLVRSIVAEPGTGGVFSGEISVYPTGAYVVYAYGVKYNTAAARTIFEDYETLTAETVAKVVTSRAASESIYSLSETRASEVIVQGA